MVSFGLETVCIFKAGYFFGFRRPKLVWRWNIEELERLYGRLDDNHKWSVRRLMLFGLTDIVGGTERISTLRRLLEARCYKDPITVAAKYGGDVFEQQDAPKSGIGGVRKIGG